MATPVIASVADQTWAVEVPVSLDVSISNIDTDMDDHSVEVTGLFAGLYYNWNNDMDRVEIRGTPESLVEEEVFTIEAVNPDGTATQNVDWEIVLSAPVIAPFGPLSVFRGVPYDNVIPVTGRATLGRVDGLWAGLRGQIAQEGIQVSGEVPLDADFTADSFEAECFAQNDAGSDTETGTFNIRETPQLYLVDTSGDDLIRVDPSDGMFMWEANLPVGTYLGATWAADESGVYMLNASNSTLYKFNASNGTQAWSSSITVFANQARVVYGDDAVYVLTYPAGTPTLYKINTSDGTQAWSYTLVASSFAYEMVYHDGAVYLHNDTTDDVYKVNADGTLAWTYTGETGDYLNIVASEDAVYVFNNTDNELYKINTSDGTLAWTYTADTGTYRNIAFGAGGVYLYNDTDNMLHKVNESGSLVWSYSDPSAIDRDPLYADNGVYLLNATRRTAFLRKLNASNGSEAWTYDPDTERMIYAQADGGSGVYLLDVSSSLLRKLAYSDGSEIWSYTAPTGAYSILVTQFEGV